MLKTILLLALFVSASLAISVTTIESSAVPTAGTLLRPLVQSAYYDMKFYKVNVPANAHSVNFTLQNLNSDDCTYLYFYMSNELPCNPRNLEGSSGEYLCDNFYNPDGGVGGSGFTVIYTPEGLSGLEWRLNQPMYIGVTRYQNYNATCTFSIQAQIQTCNATNNEIGFYAEALASTVCVPVQPVLPNLLLPISNIANNISFFGSFNIPSTSPVAAVRGVINATTDGINLYAANYGAPTTSNYQCYITSPTTNEDPFYIYNLECLVPRSGQFVFWLSHDPAPFALYNATMILTIQSCPAGMGVFNCTDVLTQYATSDNGVATVLAADSWRYFSFDFPAGVESSLELTVSANDSATLYIRKSGQPYDINSSQGVGYDFSDQYASISATSPATKRLTPSDTYNGGRYYVGVENDGTTDISFTLSANITQMTSGPTVNTADDTTETADETSPNFALAFVPSALIAALLALFASLF